MGIEYAFRSLFRSRGFALAAIVTMGVAIGATTALCSVFDVFALDPIKLPEAGRLVRLWTNNRQRNVVAPVVSVPKYRLVAEQQTVFSGVAASGFGAVALTREGADPEQLTALTVTASFVPTLGWRLVRGRNFTADEDARNGPPVCILTDDVWKTRFGSRESIVGGTVQLDGVPTEVVGVLAAGTPSPLAGVQVLLPRALYPGFLTEQQVDGGAGFLQVTARLKPGVTLSRARAEIATLSARYRETFPGRLDANNESELRTWTEEQVGPIRPTLLMLLAAVAGVLLIACANVSNLFVGRLAARRKETAVRLSLGATRKQLVRQFLLESAIFCACAAVLGVSLAYGLLRAAEGALTSLFQTPAVLPLDGVTLAFTVGLAAACSVAIGLVPALRASRLGVAEALQEGVRGTAGGERSTRFRSGLIVVEVALSIALLVGASLMLVSFVKLQSTPAGFSPRGIASAFVDPEPPRYATNMTKADFYYQVLDALKAYPQVRSAAVTQGLPLAGSPVFGVYVVPGRPLPPVNQRPIARLVLASEDYFTMLGIPLRRGRGFAATDIEGAPLVCIVNESFARRVFPDQDPIGQYLALGQQAETKLQVVGVVGDVKSLGLNGPAPETIYQPVRQLAGARGQLLVASTTGDPALLQPLFRSAVASVDKSLAVSSFATLASQVQQSFAVQRVTAWLTGAFAAIAVLLTALGLYSVLAYVIAQRTAEIAIRLALGAERRDVVGLVLGQGMRLVAIGAAIGLAAAAVGGRLLTALLYEVKPLDPAVFAGATALFTVVAALACLIPSWRATRVEVLVALRRE